MKKLKPKERKIIITFFDNPQEDDNYLPKKLLKDMLKETIIDDGIKKLKIKVIK